MAIDMHIEFVCISSVSETLLEGFGVVLYCPWAVLASTSANLGQLGAKLALTLANLGQLVANSAVILATMSSTWALQT